MIVILVTIFLKERKKNQKEEIERFFKNYEKNMACSSQDLVEKMKENELCEKVEKLIIENEKELLSTKAEFYLKTEKYFLELITEAVGKDSQNCVVFYFVSEQSKAICCETFILAKETCRILLQAVDKNLTEKFMPLWNIGWCSYYHLESKVMNYPDKKTQIIQFHWFNRKVLDRETEGCKCIHCRAFLF